VPNATVVEDTFAPDAVEGSPKTDCSRAAGVLPVLMTNADQVRTNPIGSSPVSAPFSNA
jgi:hypothetical protein